MAHMREIILCPRGQPGGAWCPKERGRPLDSQEPKGEQLVARWGKAFASVKRITGEKSPRIVEVRVSPKPAQKYTIREGIIFKYTPSSETALPFHDTTHQIKPFLPPLPLFSSLCSHPKGARTLA